ncbi:MAG TPA: diguanylate cyclase [Steroidobacteraceae bacterium]|jgi:diguanylate cyclase (GGDEF)-like protein|nr:diguanylate cyclase [Steroidobacteraceae bacterium]
MAGLERLRFGAMLPAVVLFLALPTIGVAAQVEYRSDVPLAGSSTVEYVKDPSRRLDLAAVTAPSTRFTPVLGKTVNFGFSAAAYWLHLSVQGQGAQPTTVYLSIAQSTLDDVRLYVLDRGVLQQTGQGGDRVPARARSFSASHPVFPLQIAPGERYELYLRVAGRMGALLVPMQFQSAADVEHAARTSLLLNGVFTGILGGLLIYNLFLYLSLRQRAYLYYVLLLPAVYLACTGLSGFGGWMLYPGWTWPGNQGLLLFAGSGFLLNMLFARALLETQRIAWVDRLALTAAAAALAAALSPWWLAPGPAYQLGSLLLFVMPVTGALIGLTCLLHGHPQARFFLLAKAAVWCAVMCYGLMVVGVIHFHELARQSITVGVACEALLLSLALADRIRALQFTTRRAQSATRRALESRQQELERTVEERTRELDQARRRAEYLATTDALTGVYNRRGLLPLLQQAVEQAAAQAAPLSIVSFDLDHFKRINDDFGHAEGDRVLCQLVTLTRSLIHPTDLFGRTGGEEFMLMLASPRERAVQVAEQLREHLQAHLKSGAQQRPVTASFGVAALGRRIVTLDALQRAADAALYRAKNQGRNRVETYEAGSNDTTRTRAILQSAATVTTRRPP